MCCADYVAISTAKVDERIIFITVMSNYEFLGPNEVPAQVQWSVDNSTKYNGKFSRRTSNYFLSSPYPLILHINRLIMPVRVYVGVLYPINLDSVSWVLNCEEINTISTFSTRLLLLFVHHIYRSTCSTVVDKELFTITACAVVLDFYSSNYC